MTKRLAAGLEVARVVGNENTPGRLVAAADDISFPHHCREAISLLSWGHIGQDGRMEDDERRALWRRCNERLKVRQRNALTFIEGARRRSIYWLASWLAQNAHL